MKRILVIFTALIAVHYLTSCNSNPNNRSANEQEQTFNASVMLKPTTVKIDGSLCDVLEVVEGEYRLNYTQKLLRYATIAVKIRSNGKGNPNDETFKDYTNGPLSLDVCGKQGQPIAKFSSIGNSYKDDAKLKEMMTKSGEYWVSFDMIVEDNLPKGAATFKIATVNASDLKEAYADVYALCNTVSAANVAKWDKLLDDFEDSYIQLEALNKKLARKQDAETQLAFSKLDKKVDDLCDSINRACDEKAFAPMQAVRVGRLYSEITRREGTPHK